MKTVLLTGATGYIGRHVLKSLFNLCHNAQGKIRIISIIRNIKEIEDSIPEYVQYINYDFSKNEDHSELIERMNGAPDILIHLAWSSGFDHNSDDHINYISAHYKFITNLIANGTSTVCVAGSFRECGACSGKIDENCTCQDLNNYALAKNTLRKALEIYQESKSFSFRWLRYFTPIGDEEHNNSILSKILKWDAEGRRSFGFTDGSEMYDYIPIDKLADYTVKIALQNSVQGIINVCSGQATSLKDVVEKFIEDRSLRIRPDYGKFQRRGYDPALIYGDTEKLKLALKAFDDEFSS